MISESGLHMPSIVLGSLINYDFYQFICNLIIIILCLFLGTSNRTVAATQMNATSSRAHTVVTIIFDQISKNESGQETKKSSCINLVDLAGKKEHFICINKHINVIFVSAALSSAVMIMITNLFI